MHLPNGPLASSLRDKIIKSAQKGKLIEHKEDRSMAKKTSGTCKKVVQSVLFI